MTFDLYVKNKEELLNSLNKDYSYIFELCTPYNRVVVRHNVSKLYFIGLRNKKTLKEKIPSSCLLYEIFDKPAEFSFNNLTEVENECKKLSDQEEGFVVVSYNKERFKRIKMKSKQYVEIHYETTVVTLNSLIKLLAKNEYEEYVAVFPEYKKIADRVLKEFNIFKEKINLEFNKFDKSLSSKEFIKKLPEIVEDKFIAKFVTKMFIYNENDTEVLSKFLFSKSNISSFIKYTNLTEKIQLNKKTNSLR